MARPKLPRKPPERRRIGARDPRALQRFQRRRTMIERLHGAEQLHAGPLQVARRRQHRLAAARQQYSIRRIPGSRQGLALNDRQHANVETNLTLCLARRQRRRNAPGRSVIDHHDAAYPARSRIAQHRAGHLCRRNPEHETARPARDGVVGKGDHRHPPRDLCGHRVQLFSGDRPQDHGALGLERIARRQRRALRRPAGIIRRDFRPRISEQHALTHAKAQRGARPAQRQ